MIKQETIFEALKNETGTLTWNKDALGFSFYIFSTREFTTSLSKQDMQYLWETGRLVITEETENFAKYTLFVTDKHVIGYKGARELAKAMKGTLTAFNIKYPAGKIRDFMGRDGCQRVEVREKRTDKLLAVLYREDVNQDIFEVRYI